MLENPRHLQYNCCCKRAVALFIKPLSILRLVSHSAISWCSEPTASVHWQLRTTEVLFSTPPSKVQLTHRSASPTPLYTGTAYLDSSTAFQVSNFPFLLHGVKSEIDFGIYRGLLYLRPASRVQYLQLTPQCHPAGTAPLWSQEVKWSHGKQKARLGVLPRKPLF